MSDRIYFTLLVYIKPGQEALFHQYENLILPILPEYNGHIELRMKVEKDESQTELPNEIHVVSFECLEDFENYKLDRRRAEHAPLLEEAVQKSILIKGKLHH